MADKLTPEIKALVQSEVEMILREFGLKGTDVEVAEVSVTAESHVCEGRRRPVYRILGKRSAFDRAVEIIRHAIAQERRREIEAAEQAREEAPTLSPDAAEQGPAADGPIITPELRRAVVAAAHAESVSREAHERVDALRAAADLDRPYAIGDRVALIALPSRTGTVVGLGTGRPDGIVDVRWDKPWNGVEVSGDWRRSFRRIDDQPAADLDDMADPHTYAPDTRYAAAHDAQPAAAPAVDPVAAIVDLIEQYGAARASAAVAGRFSYEGSVSYRENAADLLERIRRTLADALGTRRNRERYAALVAAGGRPVVCPCGYGVFDSCPVHDNNDSDDPAPSVEQPAAWRAPLGPQAVAALIRISNAGGRVLASTLPADIVETLVGVRWVEYVGPEFAERLMLFLTDAGKAAIEHARQSS